MASSPLLQVLICSAIDPSGGAGLVADIRVAERHGVRPVAIATATTIQTTIGMSGIHSLPGEVVRDQLERLLSDVEVHAVKIGMIGSLEVGEAIAAALALTAAPVVWDPVARASRGEPALPASELKQLVAVLAPHLALITPNRDELALLGQIDELAVPLLIKGGHRDDPQTATPDAHQVIDILVERGRRTALTGERIRDGEHVHGTGCALATAIACQLARGQPLLEACKLAKQFVAALIASPVGPGRGAPAVL